MSECDGLVNAGDMTRRHSSRMLAAQFSGTLGMHSRQIPASTGVVPFVPSIGRSNSTLCRATRPPDSAPLGPRRRHAGFRSSRGDPMTGFKCPCNDWRDHRERSTEVADLGRESAERLAPPLSYSRLTMPPDQLSARLLWSTLSCTATSA